MPLNAEVVGTVLAPVQLTITPRRALAFAAAIGDPADLRERATTASPFQCVSLEWELITRAGDGHLGLTREEAARIVHASQATCFHRPLRVGADYRVEGVMTGARTTSAGALVETRIDTIDVSDGEVAISTLTTALCRGTELIGKGTAPVASANPVPPMQAIEETEIAIDRWFPHIYTECAAIWNPIHTEIAAAERAGLPDIIVHGTALWALAGQAIAARFANADPHRLSMLAGRFTGMAFPGRLLRLRYWQDALDPSVVYFAIVDDAGKAVMSDGVARLGD